MCDQPILVSAAMDGTIRFWDTASQKNTLALQYKESQINTMCITPDGMQLAVGAWQNLRMYSLKEPTAHGLHTFNVHEQKNVTALGFQSDGKWMYTGGEDGMAKIWDMRATQLTCQRIFQVSTPVHSVALHPNQVELIVADSAGALYVWDLRTDRDDSLITEVDLSEYIVHVDIDKVGRQCAAVTNRGNLFIWNVAHSGVFLSYASPSGGGRTSGVDSASSPLAPRHYSKCGGNGNNFCDESQVPNDFAGEFAGPSVIGGGGAELECNNYATASTSCLPPLAPAPPPPPELGGPPLMAFDTSAEADHLEGNTGDQQQFHPLRNNNHSLAAGGHSSPGQQPSGQQSSGNATASALASNARPCAKISAHPTFTLKCHFRPDSLAIATTSADHTTKMWSVTNYKLLNSYSVPNNKWVWDCAFTNDSKFMITATSDGNMRMWDLATSDIVRTFQGHSLGITAMAFRDCA